MDKKNQGLWDDFKEPLQEEKSQNQGWDLEDEEFPSDDGKQEHQDQSRKDEIDNKWGIDDNAEDFQSDNQQLQEGEDEQEKEVADTQKNQADFWSNVTNEQRNQANQLQSKVEYQNIFLNVEKDVNLFDFGKQEKIDNAKNQQIEVGLKQQTKSNYKLQFADQQQSFVDFQNIFSNAGKGANLFDLGKQGKNSEEKNKQIQVKENQQSENNYIGQIQNDRQIDEKKQELKSQNIFQETSLQGKSPKQDEKYCQQEDSTNQTEKNDIFQLAFNDKLQIQKAPAKIKETFQNIFSTATNSVNNMNIFAQKQNTQTTEQSQKDKLLASLQQVIDMQRIFEIEREEQEEELKLERVRQENELKEKQEELQLQQQQFKLERNQYLIQLEETKQLLKLGEELDPSENQAEVILKLVKENENLNNDITKLIETQEHQMTEYEDKIEQMQQEIVKYKNLYQISQQQYSSLKEKVTVQLKSTQQQLKSLKYDQLKEQSLQQIQQTKQVCVNLKNELQNFSSQKLQLFSQNLKLLEHENQTLKQQQEEFDEIKDENTSNIKLIKTLRLSEDQLINENEELQSKLINRDIEYEQLLFQRDKAQQEYLHNSELYEQKILELQHQLDLVDQKGQQNEQQTIVELEEQIEQIREEKIELKFDLESKDQQLTELFAENTNLKEQLTQLQENKQESVWQQEDKGWEDDDSFQRKYDELELQMIQYRNENHELKYQLKDLEMKLLQQQFKQDAQVEQMHQLQMCLVDTEFQKNFQNAVQQERIQELEEQISVDKRKLSDEEEKVSEQNLPDENSQRAINQLRQIDYEGNNNAQREEGAWEFEDSLNIEIQDQHENANDNQIPEQIEKQEILQQDYQQQLDDSSDNSKQKQDFEFHEFQEQQQNFTKKQQMDQEFFEEDEAPLHQKFDQQEYSEKNIQESQENQDDQEQLLDQQSEQSLDDEKFSKLCEPNETQRNTQVNLQFEEMNNLPFQEEAKAHEEEINSEPNDQCNNQIDAQDKNSNLKEINQEKVVHSKHSQEFQQFSDDGNQDNNECQEIEDLNQCELNLPKNQNDDKEQNDQDLNDNKENIEDFDDYNQFQDQNEEIDLDQQELIQDQENQNQFNQEEEEIEENKDNHTPQELDEQQGQQNINQFEQDFKDEKIDLQEQIHQEQLRLEEEYQIVVESDQTHQKDKQQMEVENIEEVGDLEFNLESNLQKDSPLLHQYDQFEKNFAIDFNERQPNNTNKVEIIPSKQDLGVQELVSNNQLQWSENNNQEDYLNDANNGELDDQIISEKQTQEVKQNQPFADEELVSQEPEEEQQEKQWEIDEDINFESESKIEETIKAEQKDQNQMVFDQDNQVEVVDQNEKQLQVEQNLQKNQSLEEPTPDIQFDDDNIESNNQENQEKVEIDQQNLEEELETPMLDDDLEEIDPWAQKQQEGEKQQSGWDFDDI